MSALWAWLSKLVRPHRPPPPVDVKRDETVRWLRQQNAASKRAVRRLQRDAARTGNPIVDGAFASHRKGER